MKTIKRPIIWAILIFLIALALFSYRYYNKPHKDVKSLKASFETTAHSLFRSFEEDEATANKKYLDKIISIKGKVKDIFFNDDGSVNVILETGSDISGVSCYLVESERDKLKNYKTGDEMKIKGICTGFLVDVVIVKSIIAKDL